MTAALVRRLVEAKVPRFAEIELTLFENCNVSCSFCAHDKASRVGMSRLEMLAKLPQVERFLDNLGQEVEAAHLHLVGGELLQDRLVRESPHYLETYRDLIQAFQASCRRRGMRSLVYVVTNLLVKDTSWLLQWLSQFPSNEVGLIASYDPTGRPITAAYRRNLDELGSHIKSVNVVATRPTLARIIEGDPLFTEIYRRFPVFIDDFLPDDSNDHLIPSDEDYLAFLGTLRTRYPRLEPFAGALTDPCAAEPRELQFTTFNKCTILPDGQVTNYLWPRHLTESFRHPVDHADNANLLGHFLEENGCLACEYFQACPLRCPVSFAWKRRPETLQSGCVVRRFFDAVVSTSTPATGSARQVVHREHVLR